MVNLFFYIMLAFSQVLCSVDDWTWSYQKKFACTETGCFQGKAHLIFSKGDTPHFKQLIFSWNAYRPQQGYFIFYVKTRNALTKEWTSWYKMIEWGDAVQRSHFVDRGPSGAYHYVRLEQPKGSFADAFKLKVEPHGKADLAVLRSLHVCVSDFSRFHAEPYESYLKFSSLLVRGVPTYSQMRLKHQDCKVLCSPTSLSMLLGYLLNRSVDPLAVSKKVYDAGLQAYGSWPFNTAHAFELCPKYIFKVMRLATFHELYAHLKRRMPVVVSVRGKIPGAPQEYNNGHLLLVVGWDKQRRSVICHDPAIRSRKRVHCQYHIKHFLRAWENSRRLAYVVTVR